MKPVILFRKEFQTEKELGIAAKFIPCVEQRSSIPKDSLVIGRYSVLPFYRELEKDVINLGSKMLTSYQQHSWIASFDYYHYLKDFTFETWSERDFPQCAHPGPFIVKGVTNSRKHQWKTHCFAETKIQASRIANELANDPLIGPQGLIYRKYIPLKTYAYDQISGLPFTNEWRFFFLGKELLTFGYYWSSADDEVLNKAVMTDEMLGFAKMVAAIASQHVDFYVLDIAEKATGGYILVEINDAQMSGLSENNPETLYQNLAKALKLEKS